MRGYSLVALIFAREVSDPLTSLVKDIDKQLEEAAAQRIGARKLGVYVVFCNNDPTLKQQLQALLAKEKFKHVVLCTDDAEGPRAYRVAREAETTAVIYVNSNRVMANFPLKKGELNEDKAKEITQELTKVLPRK